MPRLLSPQASFSGWRQRSPLPPGLAGGPSPAHQADQSSKIRTHEWRLGNSRLWARCLAGLRLSWQGTEPSRAALNRPPCSGSDSRGPAFSFFPTRGARQSSGPALPAAQAPAVPSYSTHSQARVPSIAPSTCPALPFGSTTR